jgi:amino acid transporter
MLEKGKISFLQTLFLLINVVGATGIMFLPASAAHTAGRDAWITPVAGGLFGIYLIMVVSTLGKKFPNSTFFEYIEIITGKWPGKIIGVL